MERSVRQGLVLSPGLFLLVMDPLLKQLQASGLGLSLNNFYAGGFHHADDIKTLASSKKSLESQAALVEGFATENFLTLNADKCEVVVFKRGRTVDSQPCAVGGLTLPTGYAGKCLGFWWQSDLLLPVPSPKTSRRQGGPSLHMAA